MRTEPMDGACEGKRIARLERSAWRIEHADRVAFLIDGAAFFDAFVAAVEQARESILIVGWDVDSRIRLRRGDARADATPPLGRLLSEIVARRPSCHANVLDWDYAALYQKDRELLPRLQFGARTHRRVHFRLDGDHPLGASHHQKIVVVDDSVAFCGGLDLTSQRWDTPEHLAEDPRRTDPWGNRYRPFHDVQMMVSGAAAAALGDLARERWRRATGKTLPRPARRADAWPASIPADVENVEVAISRTDPIWNGRDECREVECLTIDAIEAACRHVYLETQYFTSASVAAAVERAITREDGPEIVVVCTLVNVGWLEEATMGVLRARILERLRGVDRRGRFRIYYPVVPGIGDSFLKVHSKVIVTDDRFLRIGSSNLNNRSMGLDTECDVSIEGEEGSETSRAIAGFRARLLGEHLGVEPERVAGTLAETGSLVETIERLRGGERTLEPLGGEVPEWLDALVPEAAVVDPERAVDAAALVEEILGRDVRTAAHRPFLRAGIVVGLALALAAAWSWSPLAEWLEPKTIAAALEPVRSSPLRPLGVVAAFVVAGFAVFPVTVLIFATVLLFGPWEGLAYSFGGTMLSGAATYGAGRFFGRALIDRLPPGRWQGLLDKLRRGSIPAVALVRAVPVAPFTIVNLVAGALTIPFGAYLLGTALGMAPGMVGIALVGTQLARVFRDPGWESVAWLAGIAVVIVFAGFLLRRWMHAEKGDAER
jgi:phospholipase D1/2